MGKNGEAQNIIRIEPRALRRRTAPPSARRFERMKPADA